MARLRITPRAGALHLPHRRRGPGHQDHEHPGPHGVGGQVLLGDAVLALAALAVDDRDPRRLGPGPHPTGEPPRHAHQVGVVELLVAVAVQPAPPGPEPARGAERHVGVEHDPVRAVVAAGHEVAVTGTEFVNHTATVGLASPVMLGQLPRRGHRSRASEASLGSGVATWWQVVVSATDDAKWWVCSLT